MKRPHAHTYRPWWALRSGYGSIRTFYARADPASWSPPRINLVCKCQSLFRRARIWHEVQKRLGLIKLGKPCKKKAFHTSLDRKTRICKIRIYETRFYFPFFAKLDKQCFGTHLIFPSITNIQVKHWKYCLDACFVWIDLDNLLSFCFLTHFHFTCWVCQTRSSEMVQIVCILHIEHKLGIFGP